MEFPLDFLSPLAPTGLTFQLEYFLGPLFALFAGLGEVITEAGFFLAGAGEEDGPARGDLPLLKVGVVFLLDVLGMGTANSSSQSSSGNGTKKAGLGGIFGLPLGVAVVVSRPLG